MTLPMLSFPLLLCKKKMLLMSIGGFNGSYSKKVGAYYLLKNTWKTHSQLSEGVCASSAVILKEVVYNFGGY